MQAQRSRRKYGFSPLERKLLRNMLSTGGTFEKLGQLSGGIAANTAKTILSRARTKSGMGTSVEFVMWMLNDYDALTEIFELDYRVDAVGRVLFHVDSPNEASRVRSYAAPSKRV